MNRRVAGTLVALVTVLGLELLVARALHRPSAELEAAAAVGAPRERVAALRVLACRGTPPRTFGADELRALLDDEPLLAELAATHLFARDPAGVAARVQRAWIEAHPERTRVRFFAVHRRLSVSRAALEAYLATFSR